MSPGKKVSRREFVAATVYAGVGGAAAPRDGGSAASAAEADGPVWPPGVTRTWIGSGFWANRLQDWRISEGRLECLNSSRSWPMRTVHSLTRRLGERHAGFVVAVRTGLAESHTGAAASSAAAGFLVGAGGRSMEYRSAALVHHNPGPGGGIFAGINLAGETFLRRFEAAREWVPPAAPAGANRLAGEVALRLEAAYEAGKYKLVLSAYDRPNGRRTSQAVLEGVDDIAGNVALVSHPGGEGRTASFWFRDWTVSGPKIEQHEDRLCGPVLCTQYTVQDRILKLTAQLMPVGPEDSQDVRLEVRQGAEWKSVASTRIVVPGYTAQFRIPDWDSTRDVEYRVVAAVADGKGALEPYAWSGTIRRDPAGRDQIVLAALSCVEQVGGSVTSGESYRWNSRVWFPHDDMVPNLARQKPDLLFFAGDQIYENNPTAAVREPLDEAMLDYLYKWYLWCWTYRDLTRDIPTVTIPDDHDVYQGNIWGTGGAPSRPGDPTGLYGGYGMPPEWLNMMQRTQTSHLPDPYDPRPVEQGIGVYYTSLTLGGIGFAILEDRKFKSSPAIVKAAMTSDSHITEKGYDTRLADVPGATLLGERQLRFLHEFSRDWRGQEMKAALSQTIFCNLQINSRGETAGQLDKDLDSGGWPQTGRRKALEEMRRGFMLHIAGDQHLASLVHHGIDEFEDANWSFCVPAVANLYVRYWNPSYPPLNHRPGMAPFTGRFEDGFHNKITVHAVANPVDDPKPGQFPDPVDLHRKATGYGIIRFNKKARTITMELWPRYVDPAARGTGGQYDMWPVTIHQTDNYGRNAGAWLPRIRVTGADDPVVQVVDENDGSVVYTLRIKGREFWPKVFRPGTYTVHVGEPGSARVKSLRSVRTLSGQEETVTVEL